MKTWRMTRRAALGLAAAAGVHMTALGYCASVAHAARPATTSASGRIGYTIELSSPARHFDNGESWVHARCGRIPGAGRGGIPAVVMTMNLFGARGSDVFPGVLTMRSDDLGRTWSEPRPARNLAPRLEPIGDKPLVGTVLSTHAQRGLHGLSPRLRQTLDALLAGDSEKQIAAHLNLRTVTVHEYVGSIYRRFAVTSRGELFAYFLRRRPAEA